MQCKIRNQNIDKQAEIKQNPIKHTAISLAVKTLGGLF